MMNVSKGSVASSVTCLLCDRVKPDSKAEAKKAKKDLATTKEGFWVCEVCRNSKNSEHERSRALEAAFLLENLGLNMAATPGTTVSFAATTDKNTRSLTLTMTRTTKNTETVTSTTSELSQVVGEEDANTCSCQACVERSELEKLQERELQELQKAWVQLRHAVRQMYRDQLFKDCLTGKGKQYSQEKLRELVHKLCMKDPHQLYQRLESQGREVVMDLKVQLLHLIISPENSVLLDDAEIQPDKSLTSQITVNRATLFLRTLMHSFVKFQQTVRNMTDCFLHELETEHLEKFGVTWEMVNRHLFESLIFEDPLVQSVLPVMLNQIGLKFTPVSCLKSCDNDEAPDDCTAQSDASLLTLQGVVDNNTDTAILPENFPDVERILSAWPTFQKLMEGAKELWELAQDRMEQYTVDQMRVYKATLKAKQRMLREDLEFFKKQRRLLEDYVNKRKRAGKGGETGDKDNSTSKSPHITDMASFTKSLRTLLASAGRGSSKPHQVRPTQKCSKCRIVYCPCDECAISHAISCGLITAEDDIDDLDLAIEDEEELFRSLDSASGGSVTSSDNECDDLSDIQDEQLGSADRELGSESNEFQSRISSLIPSTMHHTMRDSNLKGTSVQQHITNAYGEWEIQIDPASRLFENLSPCHGIHKRKKTDSKSSSNSGSSGCAVANGTTASQKTTTKDVKSIEVSITGKDSKKPAAKSSCCTNGDSGIKGAAAKVSSALVTNENETMVSVQCKKSEVTNKAKSTCSSDTKTHTATRPKRQNSLTEPLVCNQRHCAADGGKDTKEKNDVASDKGTMPNAHSNKIPTDILEMLKDKELSQALSAAAKKVRAQGGGPQDFLLEAEAIKKLYSNNLQQLYQNCTDASKVSANNNCGSGLCAADERTVQALMQQYKDVKDNKPVVTSVGHTHGEEIEDDDDSWSERSELSSRHCDCYYCEVFGHAASHLAPTSQNYPQIRERLRRKLKQKHGEQSANEKSGANDPWGANKGDAPIETLLEFINGEEKKGYSNQQKDAKNKRQKQKQKKQPEKKPTTEPVTTKSTNDVPELNGTGPDDKKDNKQHEAVANKNPGSATAVNGVKANNNVIENLSPAKPTANLATPSKKTKNAKTSRGTGSPAISKDKRSLVPAASINNGLQNGENSYGIVTTAVLPAPAKTTLSAKGTAIRIEPKEPNKSLKPTEKQSANCMKADESKGKTPSKNLEHIDEVCVEEVFKPKDDIDLDASDLDEADRDVEIFKRFVMDNDLPEKKTKIKVNLNIGNILRNTNKSFGAIGKPFVAAAATSTC